MNRFLPVPAMAMALHSCASATPEWPFLAPPERPKIPPSFTAAQAVNGASAYGQYCASCHGAALDDVTYANILAHLLAANGFEAAVDALATDRRALEAFTIIKQPGVDYDPMLPIGKSPAQASLIASLPEVTDAMLRGGGLLFAGDLDPSLKAFDDRTGELLWRMPLDDLPASSVVTYQVGDTQYVAVVVGMMNNWVRDISRHYRQWSGTDGRPGGQGGGPAWAFSMQVGPLAAANVPIGDR